MSNENISIPSEIRAILLDPNFRITNLEYGGGSKHHVTIAGFIENQEEKPADLEGEEF